MHSAAFAYHAAVDLPDAVEALAGTAEAAVLAGGLSLVPLLRSRSRRPELVVDINRVRELGTLVVDAGPGAPLIAGATVRQADVLAAAAAHPAHQLLATALRSVGTALTRRRGTVAGIVAHGDPALQLAPVCAVLDATVATIARGERRTLGAHALFTGHPLSQAELLTEVRFPGCRPGEGWSFLRAGHRSVGAHLGGVAARLSLGTDRRCREVRLAPFVRGHDGSELPEVAAALVGRAIDEKAVALAADLAAEHVRTESDMLATASYRRRLVRVLTARALTEAASRAVPV